MRGTFLGVAIIRIMVFWGLYWGPLILGNYQISLQGANPKGLRCNAGGVGMIGCLGSTLRYAHFLK